MNAPTMEAGGGRQAYPSAVDIPEVKLGNAPKPEVTPEANPIVSAFETIMQFVKAQEQKGAPQAATMKQHLQALIESVVGAGGEGAGGEAAPEMPPEPGAEAAPVPEGEQGAPKPITGKPVFNAFEAPPEEAEGMPPKRKKVRNQTIQPVA